MNPYENRFTDVCERLRRNDPTLTLVHLCHLYPYGYAPLLGAALLHNNNNVVTTLGINIPQLYDPKDINTHNNHNNDDNNQDVVSIVATRDDGMEMLLQYIRTSTSLQTVYIVGTEWLHPTNRDDDDDDYDLEDDDDDNNNIAAEDDNYRRKQRRAIHELLKAVARNPRIAEIEFLQIKIPPSSLVPLLQSTTSLTSFTLNLGLLYIDNNDEDDDTAISTMIRQSFGANTTLHRIALSISDDHIRLDRLLVIFEQILQSLQSHPRLREFSIQVLDTITDTDVIPILVSQFLLPHSSRSLKKLELSCFFFQHEYLSQLLHVGMKSNPQLTTLVFSYCSFYEDATNTLIDYIQRADDKTNGCCVRHLHFDLPDVGPNHSPETNSFKGRTNGQFFAALVSTTLHSQQHQLDELQIQDGAEFFNGVAASTNGEYRLPRCIRLTLLRVAAWEHIQHFLVNHHVDLQELVVCGTIDADIHPRAIVDTIRRNGSLQSVTMERKAEYEDPNLMDNRAAPINIFGPLELRFIHAYCQRNQQMMLFSKQITSSCTGSSPSSTKTTHANHVAEMMMCVIPTYFHIVRDVHRMAPTVIFQMLLSMDMSIGSSTA